MIICFQWSDGRELQKWKKKLHIQDKSWGWQVFQILRTFLLVNISWFFDRADSVGQALAMMKIVLPIGNRRSF